MANGEPQDESIRDAVSDATAQWRVGPLTDRERSDCLAALDRDAGRRYHECRLSNFRVATGEQLRAVEKCRAYVAQLPERTDRGGGLLFLGKVGTGKDHLAFAIARAAIARGYSAKWVHCLRWYATMRDRIQDDRSESAAVYELVAPSVLVLSDPLPPVGELSPYQSSNLLLVVDKRYCERRPTIVTVNLATEKDGWELIGPQVWDRLNDGADIVWCKWPSHRQLRERAPALIER